MRSAKASLPAPSALTDSELLERGARHKASKVSSQSLSSVSSAQSSDAEGPSSPCLRTKPEPTQPRHAVVIEHQGAGKVVHKPDGTVVWEPAPESAGNAPRRSGPPGLLREAVGAGVTVLTVISSVVGVGTAIQHTGMAASAPGPYCLTATDLAGAVATNVAGTIAGTVVGMVAGPLMAVHEAAQLLARPLLVGCLAVAGAKGLAKWRCGVSGLLRKLQSTDPARVLEALRAIIAAASKASPRFAREFNRLKGIEVLLQKLAEAMPDCPMLHLIAQALAELCQDQECRDSLVAAGGVPRLVGLLRHPNPVVSGYGLAALASLTDHAVAVEAIRDAGGLSMLVELTAAAVAQQPAGPVGQSAAGAGASAAPVPVLPSSSASAGFDRRSVLLPSVKLLQALSLDPAGKAAIGAAGGVQVLLDVVSRSDCRSELQCEAVAALHNCLRGCPDNQRTLAALPAASEVLRGALAGLGPCWHPCKGDLHSLLNVLARLQGVQEAGGFVVVQSQAAAAAAAPGATSGSPSAGAPAARA